MLHNFFPQPSGSIRQILAQTELSKRSIVTADKASFLYGHRDVLGADKKGKFTFTFVREPFSRLLSERRQWCQAQDENIAASSPSVATATIAFKSMDLATILTSIFNYPVAVRGFWNHQTLALGLASYLKRTALAVPPEQAALQTINFFESGITYRSWLEKNSEGILEAALENLDSLDFIGVFETFEESTHNLFAGLGLPAPMTVQHLNARSAYEDESADGIEEICAPFLCLDRIVYEAALKRVSSKAQKTTPSRRDYLVRHVKRGETLTVDAASPFGGHGWHVAHLRQDKKWGRWSTGVCSTSISIDKGWCEFEMSIYGAVSERALRELTIFVRETAQEMQVGQAKNGLWWARIKFLQPRASLVDIRIELPDGPAQFGLEVASLRFHACA